KRRRCLPSSTRSQNFEQTTLTTKTNNIKLTNKTNNLERTGDRVRVMTQVPAGDDEQLSRIRVEAEALANENEVDRSYLLPRRAEDIGVAEKVLRSAVRAVLNERARRVAA